MDEREVYPAFAALPATARAFLQVIDQTIGQGETAAISKGDFVAHGFGRGMVRATLRRLEQLGFVTIQRGGICPRLANRFQMADSWKELSESEAKLRVQVLRWRKPRTLRLLKQLARAAQNGNAEAQTVYRAITKHSHKTDADISIKTSDAFALVRLQRERPDLFERATGKPKQPRRHHFGDDAVARRLGERAAR